MPQLPQVTSCDGCGACCIEMGHPPFFWQASTGASIDPQWENVPQHLKDELAEYLASLSDVDLGQPCLWFDQVHKRCKHHEHRPQICRDFQMGGRDCTRKRLDHGIEA